MKELLVVVDYQNDFVTGALGFPSAVALEDKICEKIKDYHARKKPVLFTMDVHEKNYLRTQEGKNLPVPHCIYGTDGWLFYGKVLTMRTKNDKVIFKSQFGSAKMFEWLQDQFFQRIELVGVVSHICVLANAILAKTALPEAEIVIYSDCTASFDEKLHKEALDVMKALQITVIE